MDLNLIKSTFIIFSNAIINDHEKLLNVRFDGFNLLFYKDTCECLFYAPNGEEFNLTGLDEKIVVEQMVKIINGRNS